MTAPRGFHLWCCVSDSGKTAGGHRWLADAGRGSRGLVLFVFFFSDGGMSEFVGDGAGRLRIGLFTLKSEHA